MAAGMSRADAERRALLEFGNVAAVRVEFRTTCGVPPCATWCAIGPNVSVTSITTRWFDFVKAVFRHISAASSARRRAPSDPA